MSRLTPSLTPSVIRPRPPHPPLAALLPLLLLLLLPACKLQRSPEVVDDDYETPLFRRAKDKAELRDFPAAIELFEEVLRNNPRMAKAHLELGLIHDDKRGDYVSAIYHYKRYLKLRPTGERAKVVEEWITHSERAFAALQPNSPLQSADEVARLQKENLILRNDIEEARRRSNELEQQVARLSRQLAGRDPDAVAAAATVGPPAGSTSPAPAVSASSQPDAPRPDPPPRPQPSASVAAAPSPPQPAPAQPPPSTSPGTAAPLASRVHVVAEGETLWKIAATYYPGNPADGVQRISDANSESISDPTKLKIGQLLVIP